MAKINAVIIDPDGSVRKAKIENDLGAFQAVVGGYIEGIYGGDLTIYVNEEGMLQSLPFNHAATLLARRWVGGDFVLFGTALVVGPADDEGNDTHVHQSVIDYYILED